MNNFNKWQSFIIVCIVILAVGMFAYAQVIYSHTIVSCWIPVSIALVMTVALFPLCHCLWRHVTGSARLIPDLCIHMIFFLPFFYLIVLGANSWFASNDDFHTENVEVINKYSKRSQYYRRVSRHRRIPDGYTTTYYLLLKFANGKTKEETVDFNIYRRTALSSQKEVEAGRGLWGWDVIRTRSKQIKTLDK